MDGHCNTYTIHQDISFPRGFNTYPQTQHNNVPRNSRKIEKRVQKTDLLGNTLWNSDGTPKWTSILVDKPEPPIALPQVILGLLSLGISIGRGNSRKNPIFPKKGKSKKSKTSNKAKGATGPGLPQVPGATYPTGATGNDTGTVPKPKCTLCNGAHSNLMFCTKLPQYLPYGTNQVKPPVSLCVKCLGTIAKNAKNCDHRGNKFWKNQLCSTTNKHYLMCTGCSHHLPAIKYLSDHHKPSIGYKNFTLMKQCFGDDVYRAISSTRSKSAFNSKACKACKAIQDWSLKWILHSLISIRCPTMCIYSVSFHKSVCIVLIGQ